MKPPEDPRELVPPMARRMKYRLAERTLHYPVYLAIEWLWAIVALIGIANEFRPTGADWLLVTALAALAIVHSAKMTTLHPWLALKSILFGVVIFGLLLALRHFFGYPTSPPVIAALLASAHYLWTGEQWTTAKALDASH
jgi:hypothetical protein